MKFLVTGGAGFIGSNLVEFLLHKGHSVRVLDNFSTGRRENLEGLKGNLEVLEGSITNEKDCEKACSDGIEAVSHQAAYGSVPRSIEFPTLYSSNNLHGFVTLAAAAKANGIKTFVYASSSSVYGDIQDSPKVETRTGRPLSPYAASKIAKEYFAHAFGSVYPITMIGLRYFNVFGPKQNPEGAYAAVIPRFIHHLMTGSAPSIFGDGEQSRDFTYIDNVVGANYKALTNNSLSGSNVYNIACGFSTSINELFKKIAGILESGIKPKYQPPRAGDVRNSLAGISSAENQLGYAAAVGIDEGLEKTVAWFKNSFQS